jgi:hypothetical protein
MQQVAVSDFMKALGHSIDEDTFIKLTLSKPSRKSNDIKNIYTKLIKLKSEPALSFILRYPTKDVTKNYSIEEGLAVISLWLGEDFLSAHLFTTQEDISLLYNKKRKARLMKQAATKQKTPPRTHNHQKQYRIAADAPYLPAMGIASQKGKILASAQRKYRQINKYIEIIDQIINQVDLPNTPHIVDMGSGKGYLTFALYQYLHEQLGVEASIMGIELREQLVDFCNTLSDDLGYEQLSFAAMDIHDYKAERIDMLIALHACDIATDIAIAKGITAGAEVIIVAPCCHKQIRKEMSCQTPLQQVLRHGIMEERQAEIVTDGIRALLMEARGYQTKVFEFISTEHTPKNVMIVGVKSKTNEEALATVAAIKKDFGVGTHYLEELLGE